MSDKLGFTFYPKDWWTSDTFFELEPFERYLYLECLFIMYSNDGYMKTQKTQFEKRIITQISDEVWDRITSKFINDENGFTHLSVNKRLRKTLANRENGKKGGRPRKDAKPKKPNKETQKNPPLEREREREGEYKSMLHPKEWFDFLSTHDELMMKLNNMNINSKYWIKKFIEAVELEGAKNQNDLRSYCFNWIKKNRQSEFK